MKVFYSIVIFRVIINLVVEGAEYVEAPFQKYGVMLTQKKLKKFSAEIFPLVLFGEKFLCELPGEEEILNIQNSICQDINVLKERINAIPCLLRRESEWSYVICPHVIHRMHIYNFTQNILGVPYRDNYNSKLFEGFWGKGEQTFFTRHFTSDGSYNLPNKDVKLVVWYFCRQSEEESVFFLQQTSPNQYEIRIFTPRVCSDFNFESKTGYEISCFSKKDAMALVLGSEDSMESPRYSFGFNILDSPKSFRGGVFFVANSNNREKEPVYEGSPRVKSEEMCVLNSAYRADEIMSASLGLKFNRSINPRNQTGKRTPYTLYQKDFFQLFVFESVLEKFKKLLLYF